MLNWLRKLMPREDRFFDLFAQTRKDRRRCGRSPPVCVRPALYSLGHGGNDAQKTMGIIADLLYSQRYWRVISSYLSWSSFHAKCNGTRYAFRRLADGPRDGIEDYASQPNAGLLCRNRRSSDIGWRNLARHRGFDHTQSPLGLGGQHCCCLGCHTPRRCDHFSLRHWLSGLFH